MLWLTAASFQSATKWIRPHILTTYDENTKERKDNEQHKFGCKGLLHQGKFVNASPALQTTLMTCRGAGPYSKANFTAQIFCVAAIMQRLGSLKRLK